MTKLKNIDRFVTQLREDYMGTPTRAARVTDSYGEEHVLIESTLADGTKFYFDWIGAELATEPDEWGDDVPDYRGIRWARIGDGAQA